MSRRSGTKHRDGLRRGSRSICLWISVGISAIPMFIGVGIWLTNLPFAKFDDCFFSLDFVVPPNGRYVWKKTYTPTHKAMINRSIYNTVIV